MGIVRKKFPGNIGRKKIPEKSKENRRCKCIRRNLLIPSRTRKLESVSKEGRAEDGVREVVREVYTCKNL